MILKQFHSLSACIVLLLFLHGSTALAQGNGRAWLEFGTIDTVHGTVGAPVHFDVVMRDAAGDTIRDWNTVGHAVELQVVNATAELDTSVFSWSAQPDNYTWLNIMQDGAGLIKTAPQGFLIEASQFTDGVAHLAFISSAAETGTRIESKPLVDSAFSRSPPVTWHPRAVDHLFVERSTWLHGCSDPYVMRPMEVVVTPRDRFLNPVSTPVDVMLTAKYVYNELYSVPGYPPAPLDSAVTIRGAHSFYLLPAKVRMQGHDQGNVLTAYDPHNFNITGVSDSFYVAPHVPYPYDLHTPDDRTVLRLAHPDDMLAFQWEQPSPPDPYHDVNFNRRHPRMVADTLRYRIHFMDTNDTSRQVVFDSDDDGLAPAFHCTEEMLAEIADSLVGKPDVPTITMIWYVRATDGVDSVRSTPSDTTQPGHRLTIHNDMFAGKGVALQFSTPDSITRAAGEAVEFAFVAMDGDGQIVPDWNVNGKTVLFAVRGSLAEQDTSERAWGDDPDGYSWTRLEIAGEEVPLSAAGEYHIPHRLFSHGRAQARYISSKAGEHVRMEILPEKEGWTRESPLLTWHPGPLDNILVDVTWPYAGQHAVYVNRPYELVVMARDRFLNPLTEETTVRVKLRYPDEVSRADDTTQTPDGSILTLPGARSTLLLSDVVREDTSDTATWHSIEAFALADSSVHAVCDAYRVLDHPPAAFRLMEPADRVEITLPHRPEYWAHRFSWEQPDPPDPFTNIAVSRFNDVRMSDTLRYTVHLLSMPDMGEERMFLSDDSGRAASRHFSDAELREIIRQFAGHDSAGTQQDLLWYVEVTDGTDTTWSDPLDSAHAGYRLRLKIRRPLGVEASTPAATALAVNYPNPFRRATRILYRLEKAERVVLAVTDAYGRVVQRLLDGETREAGFHHVEFDAAGLPAGVYFYTLVAGGRRESKRMLLLH